MRSLTSLVAAALITALAGQADARTVAYLAQWSGAELGNEARAVGLLTVDDSLLSNPGDNGAEFGSAGPIVDVAIIVWGASSGNGTFTTSDFMYYAFSWNTALDLDAELVGQFQVLGGPWGTHAGQPGFVEEAHDFNLFAPTSGAPNGTFYYELTTGSGDEEPGDRMYLTSFAFVPEPTGTLALWASVGTLGCVAWRRRALPPSRGDARSAGKPLMDPGSQAASRTSARP